MADKRRLRTEYKIIGVKNVLPNNGNETLTTRFKLRLIRTVTSHTYSHKRKEEKRERQKKIPFTTTTCAFSINSPYKLRDADAHNSQYFLHFGTAYACTQSVWGVHNVPIHTRVSILMKNFHNFINSDGEKSVFTFSLALYLCFTLPEHIRLPFATYQFSSFALRGRANI